MSHFYCICNQKIIFLRKNYNLNEWVVGKVEIDYVLDFELASYLEDAPWPATKDELIDFAMRTGAPLEVVENLQSIEDEGIHTIVLRFGRIIRLKRTSSSTKTNIKKNLAF